MTNVFTIEEIFTGRLFRVPDYQRGYAWEVPHCTDFIDDLELLGEAKDHYTGTLVLHAVPNGQRLTDDEGKSYAKFNVVDGQQRLTTIVVLLDAIRREMLPCASLAKLAEGIRRNYITVTDLPGQQFCRLTLNRDCHHYFETNILSDTPGPEGPTLHSHVRLLDARRYLAQYLAARRQDLGAGYETWLLGLHNKVTHQLKVCLYEVDDASDVGVIFETMNNRGKPLSELEKVKNYLLYLASKLDVPAERLTEEVNRTWTDVFERLMRADLGGSADEDQLLRAHWLMAYSPDKKTWDGSHSVKSVFGLKSWRGKHSRLLGQLQKYAKTLGDLSLAYCDVINPTHTDAFAAFPPPLSREVKRWSQKLHRIGVMAPFLPLLGATRLRFPSDGEKYLRMVKLCELFAFRVYRWDEWRSHSGQSKLFRIGHRLFSGELSFDEAVAALCSQLLYYCPNRRFEESFEPDPEDNWYDWPGLKYFLYEYEEYLAEGDAVQVPWEVVLKAPREQTIEHVLPQTPDDPYWTSRFDEAARKRFTHDIGNLSLTSHNSAYRNKPFAVKKGKTGQSTPCYANSNLFMERALAQSDQWTEREILARREAIVAWAKGRWQVEEVPIAASLSEEADDDPEEGE